MKRIIAWFKALFQQPETHSDITPQFRQTMDTAIRWSQTAKDFKVAGWRY